jgi:tripeptidyl-peptidase-2
LERPLKWEKVVNFASSGAKSFSFKVISGQTLEVVISQFWSSGIGSHETASVDFEVTELLLQ